MAFFFGRHLVEQGFIDDAELTVAVKNQDVANLRLGEVAVRDGYITRQAIMQIHSLQRERDLFFGEAAIELGYLDQNLIDELLAEQQKARQKIGEVLIELGFVEADVLSEQLRVFEDALPEPIDAREAAGTDAAHFIDMAIKFFVRFWGINSKLVNVESVEDGHDPGKEFVSVKILGDAKMSFTVMMDDALAQQAALNMFGSVDSEEIDSREFVSEFCNMVGGNVIGELPEEVHGSDLTTPEVVTTVSPGAGHTIVFATLATPYGEVEMYMTSPE